MPETIHRYRIKRQLGQGAMGTVYLAEDPSIERLVAIKTIRVDAMGGRDGGSQLRERFLKEAKIAGRLGHPSVVTVYDVGEDKGLLYFAMEYVEGESLSSLLSQRRRFSMPETLDIVVQVARGLAHAHARGVVHRDVKPGNIMLTADGVAKVTDFGISKLLASGGTELTSTGQIIGSPSYMSPEQVRGEAVDERSDVFALGIVLYELLTNAKPFPSETITTLVYQILNVEPRPAIELIPSLPADVNAIVQRAIRKDPSERYASAREMADDLDRARAAMGRPGDEPTRAGVAFSGASAAPPPLPASRAAATTAGSSAAATTAGSRSMTDLPPRVADSPTVVPVGHAAMQPDLPSQVAGAATRVPERSRAPIFALLAALLFAAVVGLSVMLWMRGQGAPAPGPAPAPSPTTAVVGASPGVASPAGPAETWSFPVVGTPLPPETATTEMPVAGAPGATSPGASPRPTAIVEAPAPSVAPPEPPRPPQPADHVFATRGGVDFDISPDDAQLIVDGRAIGKADDWDGSGGGRIWRFETPGYHYVRARMPGYRETSMRFDVSPNAGAEVVSVDVSLEELEGSRDSDGILSTRSRVTFNVDPEEAQVYVNGQLIGTADQWSGGRGKEYPLSQPGTSTIRIVYGGYVTYTTHVRMSPGAEEDEVELEVDLKKSR